MNMSERRTCSFKENGYICGEWAGKYSNISIFEVSDPAELHEILSSLPLYPFMQIEVTALCKHPGSLELNK